VGGDEDDGWRQFVFLWEYIFLFRGGGDEETSIVITYGT